MRIKAPPLHFSLYVIVLFVSVMRKSFSHLNELILFGGLLVYTMVIVYGFDGQFFEFTNSSLALCYVSVLL